MGSEDRSGRTLRARRGSPPEPEVTDGQARDARPSSWTAVDVLRASLSDAFAFPVWCALALGVGPECWAALGRYLGKSAWPGAKFSWLFAGAWSSLSWGGQILVALDVARRRTPKLRSFAVGVRRVGGLWILAVTCAIPAVTSQAAHALLRPSAPIAAVVLWSGLTGSAILSVRFFASPAVLLDRGCSVLAAARKSWAWNRGHGRPTLVLVFVLWLGMMGGLLLSARAFLWGELLESLATILLSLALAEVYLRTSEPSANAGAAGGASMSDQDSAHPPHAVSAGSGWARDAK